MFKKALILAMGFFSFAVATHAYGVTYRIDVDRVINKRNIVITHPETQEKYLLELDSGCNKMNNRQTVNLSIQGALDSRQDDVISVDATQKCKVVVSRKFTHQALVDYTYRSNTQARLIDDNGIKYTAYYPDSCASIRAYTGDYIYLVQGSDEISAGDRVILPDGNGECSLGFVRKIAGDQVESPSVTKRPKTVANVKAIPQNGQVFLDWRENKEEEIKYYAIAVLRGKTNMKGVSTKDVSGLIKTPSVGQVIKNLVNEQTYYFYIKAINAAGEESSDWSTVASATPKSSIFTGVGQSSSRPDMNLKVRSESNLSFLIDWDTIPGADRYVVLFEIDGERQWARTEYPRSYIRVLKRSNRKGKTLKLIVRAYLRKDYVEEQSIEFEF